MLLYLYNQNNSVNNIMMSPTTSAVDMELAFTDEALFQEQIETK